MKCYWAEVHRENSSISFPRCRSRREAKVWLGSRAYLLSPISEYTGIM